MIHVENPPDGGGPFPATVELFTDADLDYLKESGMLIKIDGVWHWTPQAGDAAKDGT